MNYEAGDQVKVLAQDLDNRRMMMKAEPSFDNRGNEDLNDLIDNQYEMLMQQQ